MKKFKSPLRKTLISLLALITILSGGIFLTNAAEAAPQLKKVGPIDEENGFPVWYKDSNNIRLQLCLDPDVPGGENLCALDPAELDFPEKSVSFPNNFPHEAFYMLASSEMETASGGRARAGFQLEAAFAQEVPIEGDQIVFGRIRFRVDGLITGETYKITHPYGVDTFVAEPEDSRRTNGPGEINFTEDIGITGGFEAVKQSRIGTFLKWDPAVGPAAPGDYIGNPNEDHKVIGSPYGTNIFEIEGPGIGISNGRTSPDSCGPDCIKTDLFSLMGKEATTAGVDVLRATYSQDTAGSGTIDVFAATEEDKKYNFEVDFPGVNPNEKSIKGLNGQYFGRVTYKVTTPENVTVINTTDIPNTKKVIPVVDYISATAKYDTNSQTFFVTASSSDKVNNPKLTVQGLDKIVSNSDNLDKTIPATGTLAISSPQFVPPTITIKSAKNGSTTVPVEITSEPAIANPGEAQTGKRQGFEMSLDGSASINAATYTWKQVSGPAVTLSNSGVAKPTFTFPKQFVPVSFELTVTDANGVDSTNVSIVTITPAPDKLTVSPANFSGGTGTLNVSGTSDVFGPGVRITIFKTNQTTPLGTAVVGTDGKWAFSKSPVTFVATDTLTIQSSSGGKLNNVPIVRNR